MGRYPATAYRQLFPEGGQGKPLPLNRAEDGDHYRSEPDFFEWWYFDAAFEDSSYLVAVLHSALFSVSDHRPTLDLRYHPPEGQPLTVTTRFDRAAYRAAPDRCRVQMGDNLAVDEGDHYRLNLHHKLLEASLTFRPELEGCKVGTGHIFADASSGHHFDWVIPLPRARVEGNVIWAGQQHTLVGAGYHDHNWGNVYLPSAVDHWTWGRVRAGDWTLVFGDVVERGTSPAHVTPLMLARGNEIVLTTDHVRIHGEGAAREPRTGMSYCRHLELVTLEEPAVELALEPLRVMESVNFAAPYPPLGTRHWLRRGAETAYYLAQRWPIANRLAACLLGRGSYVRWKADFRLCLPDRTIEDTGQALCEVMAF